MKKCVFITGVFIALLFFSACKKQSETYITPPLSDYFPLQIGKYVTYDLDSLTFVNFGESFLTTHYQVQYYTDDTITDNIGRKEYVIIRYIRNTPLDPWVADNTFTAVNTGNTIEWVEDNLRFIKLAEPIVEGFSWNGNSYIDASSLTSNLTYLYGWSYNYDSLNVPLTLDSITVDSTIKVNEDNEIQGDPGNPNAFSEIDYSSENYAKGIGLVYRNFLHQEYQTDSSAEPGYHGYGITLTMIDHN
jgi:hypothetical protein